MFALSVGSEFSEETQGTQNKVIAVYGIGWGYISEGETDSPVVT